MIDPINDKNYIENLINALSVDEAVGVFTNIDNKIIQLLECSSEDFLTLNDHFKKYFKESKKLSQNASDIIQLITLPSVHKSFEDLKLYKNNFNNLNQTLSTHTDSLEFNFHKALNKYEGLFIAHNNYKQNLTTLKLLVVNIELKENANIDATDVENKVAEIKALLSKADSIFEQFKSLALENLVIIDDLKKDNKQHQDVLNEYIESSFVLFTQKYNEANSLMPDIKEQSDKCATSIANIITNLQYHDIIRQKIEHIQKTHKDILLELKSYGENDNNTLLHNRAKTFLKIRDIAGLQAAQLLHANKQYQVAIVEIAKNLEYIGNEVISIAQQCEKLTDFRGQSSKVYLKNIIDNLNIALENTNKISSEMQYLKSKIEAISVPLNNFSNVYSEINAEKDKVINIIKALNLKYATDKSKDLSQINELAETIQISEHNIQSQYNEIKDILVNIIVKENFEIEKQLVERLKDASVTMPYLVGVLNQNAQQIQEYLEYNANVSYNVTIDIKDSVKQIKYYDLFEKVCEAIIEDLNALNLKLNYGNDPASEKHREENLKLLKERYTMASEHLIHEQFANVLNPGEMNENTEQKIIDDISEQKSESDDENLELF